MPLSQEAKDETLTMLGTMDAKAVAQAVSAKYGLQPIAVHGFIQQHKWKTGEIPRPKNMGRPKKVKETVTKTYDEEAPEILVPGVSSTIPNGGPLFDGVPGKIIRVEIHRTHALPRYAGIGLMGEDGPDTTEADIQSMYGGGKYQIKGFDSDGRCIKTRSIMLAGRSKRADAEDPDETGGYFYPPMGGDGQLMPLLQGLQQQLLAFTQREREEDRLTFEQRLQLERERMKNDMEMRERAHQQALQQTAANNAQMMQILVAATSGKGNSLGEMMAVMSSAKDLFGDSGGGGGDITAEIVKTIPGILGQVGTLARLRGAPGQAQLPQGQTQDPLVALKQELLGNGLSEQEADQALQEAGQILVQKVMLKQQQKAPPKPQRPQGSVSRPQVMAPPQPKPPAPAASPMQSATVVAAPPSPPVSTPTPPNGKLGA